jgi:hypothetical protein
MMLSCPVCNTTADCYFEHKPWDSKKNLKSRRCSNRIRIEPLGPGESMLVHHDPDGKRCPGVMVRFRPLTPTDQKEAA